MGEKPLIEQVLYENKKAMEIPQSKGRRDSKLDMSQE